MDSPSRLASTGKLFTDLKTASLARIGVLVALCGWLLVPSSALAETQTEPESEPTSARPEQRLSQRPRLLRSAEPRYPPEAWEQDIEGDVTLLLWVSEQGKVEAASILSSPGHGLGPAALVAAKKLRFAPAEVDGQPVKVKIRYTFKFRKPERAGRALPPSASVAEPPADDRVKGTLRGVVLQRGTGEPLAGAEVYVLDLDEAILTDESGRFSRQLAPGGYAITINVPEHYPFQALERIEPGDVLEVEYFVEPGRRDRYRTVVWGSENRAMVGRTTLADEEIYEVPGTLGDPMRVVMLMPGVTSSVTGLGYPMVRGVLPGDTRYEVDGVQVPMLYHVMFGNAVVNPRFTTGITFQPGGYSVRHGQFPGALISAGSTPKPEQTVTAADVSLVHASLFHARPLSDEFQVVGAGRYGTLGLIIEALASNVIFRYWDYQAKTFFSPSEEERVELMVFGAGNQVGEERDDGTEGVLTLGFHRALLRGRRAIDHGWLQVDAEVGQEGFRAPEPAEDEPDEADEGPGQARYRYVGWRTGISLSPARDFEFRSGIEGYIQDFGFFPPDAPDLTFPEDGITLGGYLEAEWTPGPWTIVSGVRADHYRYGIDGGPRQTGSDPRLALGYDLTERLTAKASTGLYQGPPRVTLVEGPIVIGPVPGMMGVGLERGLTRALQNSAGLEARLPWRLQAEARAFYTLLDVPLDFSLMNVPLTPTCGTDVCTQPPDEAEEPPPRTEGRSYGLELLLRRRLGESLFGWATYTLSRSEREVPGVGTLPFAFDQTHVVNTVASWEVGRHWTLGTTFHYHSGRPYTPERGVECDDGMFVACTGEPFSRRLPGFWRVDARVQKRELYETWYFDFYIDVINVTFNREVVGYEVEPDGRVQAIRVPIFVPMLGLRGQF